MSLIEKPKKDKFPLGWLTGIFVLLTVLGMGVVFFHAGGLGSTIKALKGLWQSPGWILLLLGVLWLDWCTDHLRYWVIARHMGMKIPFGFGLRMVFANLFFSYLTPGGTFGAPVIVYMLYKRGESISKSIALALIKPFLLFFLLLCSGGLVLAFNREITISPTLRNVALISGGVVLLLTALVAMIIFRPAAARAFTDRLFGAIRRRVLRNSRTGETSRLDRWESGVDKTINAFALFGQSGWKGLLEALVATLLNLLAFIALSVVLLHIAGIQVAESIKWVYSFLYYFFIAFAPTPGASGLAEGGGYLFFQTIAPASQVSTYVLLWRFFSCYLAMFVGAALSFGFIRKVRLSDLRRVKEVAEIADEEEAEPSAPKEPKNHSIDVLSLTEDPLLLGKTLPYSLDRMD